jgi:uncharacterized protein YndB with AHSA1/START domain
MSRSHETRIVIDAPIEEVWKSIAEAGALARWFAPQMTVEPGAGGSMLADWGPGLAWKTAIEVWEPNRHIRLSETRDHVMSSAPGEQKLEPCRLIQDWYLESENGKTVLRLVHSGFGSSADWDTEYFGTKYGWASCFLRLKHVTEYHRTEPVHNGILTHLCDVPWEEALGRIETVLPARAEIALREKYHLSAILHAQNGSILTISLQPTPAGTVVYVEYLLFELTPAAIDAFKDFWRSQLTLFPAPS